MINQVLDSINTFLYSNLLIFILIAAGLFFTIITKCVQVYNFSDGLKALTQKSNKKGAISAFQSLMISTASRVGTGNIAGVATAIAAGGPGAVFWMWVCAMFGGATAFIESVLAQVYKEKDGNSFIGGPAFYIEKALKCRWLGVVFAVLLIATFAVGFNALQAFNVSSALNYYDKFGLSKQTISIALGIILAVLTGITIYGGMKRIGVITSVIVPIMAILYIGIGIYIIVANFNLVPQIFKNILVEATNFRAIFGGFAGSSMMYGIKRGLFSNEAGMGSAPNACATADVSHPAKQGFVHIISVFIDTILICTTTAMILLIYGTDKGVTGMPYVQAAVTAELGSFGIHFITISIFLFAFSSLIGNYAYSELNFKYITKNKIALNIFRALSIVAIFAGTLASFDLVWNLADVLMGLMAVVNIFVILLLRKTAIKVLKDYRQQKKDGKDPVFVASKVGIKDTDCWK